MIASRESYKQDHCNQEQSPIARRFNSLRSDRSRVGVFWESNIK
ncbi:MAG: hypothetical protein EZS28_042409 [Streblomastix strix]|uniref:Uncharacterized protein n=1 Tax=Streblomastix strix TaxID=222440 RepID=A0A5J4TVW4_9EUKA|nr:MAG: hypothetical protein EZS28_042409 [Streblomastix strix]